jgi:hypothetical protein
MLGRTHDSQIVLTSFVNKKIFYLLFLPQSYLLGGEGNCSAWHERVPIQNLFSINEMKPNLLPCANQTDFICVNMISALAQKMCKPDWSDLQVMCEKYIQL